jgi:aminodeoxyfutalosine synthase
LVSLIKQVKREPVERDTLYNEIKNYAGVDVAEMELNPVYN